MVARRRMTERCKALRLACWTAVGMRGRKLELEHFLSQHGVDICLLSETFLNTGQAFRLANYVCHRTDKPTAGGRGGRHSHFGPPWYSPPFSARSGPDPLASYCHPSHTGLQTGVNPFGLTFAFPPTDRSGLTACFGVGLPVLMTGDLNATHVDWNSRLNTRRQKLLRHYADENSCLIFGPDSPTTNPYNPSVTPDVLDIVITKNLSFPVCLTSCSALSSDHLQGLIDTACRSSFQHPPDRPDWANFKNQLEKLIPLDLELHKEMAIDTCVENFSGAVLKALAASTPKRRPRDDPRPPIPAGIQDEIRLKNPLRRQWQIARDPALKAEVNRLQRSVTRRLEWRNDQWGATLESLGPDDQSPWRMTKRVMSVPTLSPPLPVIKGGNRSL